MTVITDLLPIAIEMSERRLTGAYNFINPVAYPHEILSSIKNIDQPLRG
jgi:hypothetical protein